MNIITPEVLARVACAQFVLQLTPAQLLEIARGEKDPDDCCDGNMVLADAFRHVVGRESWLPSDVEEGLCSEAAEGRDLALWNDAAYLMRARRYYLPDARTAGDEEALTSILTLWCDLQGLDAFSADEMLVQPDLSPEQRQWLSAFVQAWEDMRRAELEG